MNWEPIKKAIGVIAPTVGTLLGGPLGGMVAGQLSNLLTGKPDATPKELLQSFGNADPAILLKIQELENDIKIKTQQMNIDLHKMQLDDVANARQRQIELAKLGIKDNTVPILALSIVFGFFITILLLFFVDVPDDTAKVLNVILGILGTSFSLVLSYYFGATRQDDSNRIALNEDK